MNPVLIHLPETAKVGEVVAIRVTIQHAMETGHRPDAAGRLLPRDILTGFVCRYDGVEIFRADMHPALSANPFFAFHTRATRTGEVTFTWTGDGVFAQTETRVLTVA